MVKMLPRFPDSLRHPDLLLFRTSWRAGQTFTVPALPSQGIAIDNLSVTFLHANDPDTDGDGIADSLDPDDDNDTQPDDDELAFGTDPIDAGTSFRTLLSPRAINCRSRGYRVSTTLSNPARIS